MSMRRGPEGAGALAKEEAMMTEERDAIFGERLDNLVYRSSWIERWKVKNKEKRVWRVEKVKE